MKKRTIFGISGIVLAGAGAFILITSTIGGKDAQKTLQFAEAVRGPIRVTISSTGTLNAARTVQVGTQVSGTISFIYVDFNDRVRKNQVLAVLDSRLLEIAVRSAQADLIKANTQYEFALKDFQNNQALHDRKLISDYDLDSARLARDAAYSAKLQAEAAMARAQTNLDYATILAPIDGTIIERNVEQGQTVASSLSAPVLFSIAEDLSNIQIQAYVSESDIGSIKPDQNVTFTVTTYPNDVFTGVVQEIHLKPVTVSNVVNYVVLVNVVNSDHRLMPGMTATIDFTIGERTDALTVPNAVLRYKPTDAMLLEYAKDNPDHKGPTGNRLARDPAEKGRDQRTAAARDTARLWYYDEGGSLRSVTVRTGLSDGQKTEIISDAVKPGMKFITGTATAPKATQTTNPQVPRGMFH